MREESDFLGKQNLPAEALYGIHAWRSRQNFPCDTLFHKEWYCAMGKVKLAAYQTILALHQTVSKELKDINLPAGMEDMSVFENLCEAASEVSAGKYFEHFIVPALQGGAGTSINMNVNEILSNLALQKMGIEPGNYQKVDPLRHANLFQSTNDIVPTALKLAIMELLTDLESGINALRSSFEKKEGIYRNDLRLAYTQMQEAVPSSFGMLFGAWSEALARDWWRVSKCFERIKVVNLGGGATGSGLAIPRFYVMEVLGQLQKLTNMPLTRSENLSDATQNLDPFVEVHAILKAYAVNLEKIAGDLRLLSSDNNKVRQISIPAQQLGSSMMPGKINPVISEYVISSAHKVYSNDMLITSLCGKGSLDLNPYIPAIGHAMLESIKLLIAAGKSLKENLVDSLTVEVTAALNQTLQSPSITTALIPYVGYEKATDIAAYMKENGCDIFEANAKLKVLPDEKIAEVMKPENLIRLGYSFRDL